MTGPSRTQGVRVRPLDVWIHQDSAELLAGAEERTAADPLPSSPAPCGHAAWRTPREMDVSDAVPSCSSLPGAAGSCPRPGLCGLKARS